MATKEEVQKQLEIFAKEWNKKLSIWAFGVGPAGDEYDEYGRLKSKNNIRNFAIQVYTGTESDIEKIPTIWNNIPVMVFVDVKLSDSV